MKIAFLYSGQIRDLETTGEQHRELVKELKADVYGSFWSTTDSSRGNTVELFTELLDPVAVEVEDLNAWEESTLFAETQSEIDVKLDFTGPGVLANARKATIFPMWYKVWRANFLRHCSGKDYDLVVRLRTDLIFHRGFSPVMNSWLNIPSGIILITHGYENLSFGPHDFLAYGNSEVMDYYCSLYHSLHHYFRSGEFTAHPENVLRVHLSQKDLTLRFWGDEVEVARTGYRNWDSQPGEYTLRTADWKRTPPPELNCRSNR